MPDNLTPQEIDQLKRDGYFDYKGFKVAPEPPATIPKGATAVSYHGWHATHRSGTPVFRGAFDDVRAKMDQPKNPFN